MKTIIIATDFSTAAMNAATYGIKMAESVKADVMLFNVFEVLANYGEMVIDINVDNLKKDAVSDMEALKSELIRNTGTKINITSDVRLGVFNYELNTLCETVNPYAVIMGSQGKAAAERVLFGTHALYAMKHLVWPLITIPATATFSAIKNIGLAYDFEKELDSNFTEEIKLLAHDFDATIHVLNAAKEDEFDADFVMLSSRLEKMLAPFTVKYHFITSDNANQGIIDFADKNDIDLLIVMPKYHSLLEKIIFKSHIKQMVLHSHVPVLALHK
jgi:nucleotide-binding universal stress UspA family protein